MQTIRLPTDTAFYTLRCDFEGVNFLLDFHWIARQDTWLMSIADDAGTPLVSGLTVVSNRLLLRRFRGRVGLPAGDLIAADPTREIDAPNYTQLGTDVQLVYVTATELG